MIDKSTKNDGRIPIFLGVTGHRNLRSEDLEKLKAKVESLFKEIQTLCPNSPIALLSPLAEGADRLVARVALGLGIRLVVPLPMPIEEYKKDFKSPESLAGFEDLLGHAEKYFELPMLQGNTPENIGPYGDRRGRQYTQVGAYIARHSQILIAIWDGIIPEKLKGTSIIVDFRLKGIPEPYAPPRTPLDHIENGPVYHIVTPRVSNNHTEGKPFSAEMRYPKESNDIEEPRVTHARILQRIDDYNRDILRVEPSSIKESRKDLIPDDALGNLTPEQRTILEHYAYADRLAMHFQTKSRWALVGLLVFVVIGFTCFQIYLELFRHSYVLLFYPLALAAAYSLYSYAKRRKYQEKYLDYRAVAEGQRLNLFWNIGGIKEDVVEHYLRKQKGELDWIRQAIKNVTILARGSGSEVGVNPDSQHHVNYNILLDHWVNNQRDYFIKVTKRDRLKLERQERRSNIFYGIGIALAVGMLIIHGHVTQIELVHHIVIISIAVSLALAGTINYYSEKAAFSEQFKQYQRMKDIFTRASDYLTKALNEGNQAKTQEIIKELGKEALMENGDWVLLHRSRPIGVPKG